MQARQVETTHRRDSGTSTKVEPPWSHKATVEDYIEEGEGNDKYVISSHVDMASIIEELMEPQLDNIYNNVKEPEKRTDQGQWKASRPLNTESVSRPPHKPPDKRNPLMKGLALKDVLTSRMSELLPMDQHGRLDLYGTNKLVQDAYRDFLVDEQIHETFRGVPQLPHIRDKELPSEAPEIKPLRGQWLKENDDMLQKPPPVLPPFREINHKIPLIDDHKVYRYHLPQCLDAFKPQLLEKIAKYVKAQ